MTDWGHIVYAWLFDRPLQTDEEATLLAEGPVSDEEEET